MKQDTPVSEEYFCPKLNTTVELTGIATTSSGKTWLTKFECSHCCKACGVANKDSVNRKIDYQQCSKHPNLSINGIR